MYAVSSPGDQPWTVVAREGNAWFGLLDGDAVAMGSYFHGDAVVTLVRAYCAIGEAVNGPGGYFGWNLDALDACLTGGWGATTPFTLHWDASAEARARLVQRVPAGDREAALFDVLLQIFEERGVSVFLR